MTTIARNFLRYMIINTTILLALVVLMIFLVGEAGHWPDAWRNITD